MEALRKQSPVPVDLARRARRSHPAVARIVVGASTGAVPVVELMLTRLCRPCPPVVIAQHMPGHFLGRLADRLQAVSDLPVELVRETAVLTSNKVFLAGGAPKHVQIVSDGTRSVLRSFPSSDGDINCPAIDRLFASAAALPDADRTLAILLSGMGHDGAQAMAALKRVGAETWVEDPQTATVSSMPQSAIQAGADPRILPGPALAHALALRLQRCNLDAR